MFSILLGKDDDYVDKRKLEDELNTGGKFAPVNPNPPFVSEDNNLKGDRSKGVLNDGSFAAQFDNAKLDQDRLNQFSVSNNNLG